MVVVVIVIVAVVVGPDGSAAHFAEHFDDANNQRFGSIDRLDRTGLKYLRDVEDGAALHCGTACYGVESRLVGFAVLPDALRDVEGDRDRRPPKLVGQGGIASRNVFGDSHSGGHQLNRELIDIEPFVIEHRHLSGGIGQRAT